ncbi:MAG: YdeI/OmpD-associated family protein [Bacteroidota bacterium]|nr:YdeI/OmpD-associated family protein [Bacteroidota bacterium]
MVQFTTTIRKFDKQGEKTGWTYVQISAENAENINPGVKTSYRVKGKLDAFAIEKTALLPMGDGSFIIPLNAAIRKGICKGKGDILRVQLELDTTPPALDVDFLECLHDEPEALRFFQSLTKGHQNYFSKWVESAKTSPTKAKRIAMAVIALSRGLGFSEMLQSQKAEKQKLGF